MTDTETVTRYNRNKDKPKGKIRMSEKYEPCPRCGSTEIKTLFTGFGDQHHIACMRCGLSTRFGNKSVVPEWNKMAGKKLKERIKELEAENKRLKAGHKRIGQEGAKTVKAVVSRCRDCRFKIDDGVRDFCLLTSNPGQSAEKMRKGLIGECKDFKTWQEGESNE